MKSPSDKETDIKRTLLEKPRFFSLLCSSAGLPKQSSILHLAAVVVFLGLQSRSKSEINFC